MPVFINGEWVNDYDDEWAAQSLGIKGRNPRAWGFVQRYYVVRNRLTGREQFEPEEFRSDLIGWRARTTNIRSALARLAKELRAR